MPNSYEIPAFGTQTKDLLGWLLEAVSEGDGWLKAQRPSIEWPAIMEMLGPQNPGNELKGQSNVGFNLVERNARDIVASLSNFRHEVEFRPRHDKALYDAAHRMTKVDKMWYAETYAHEAIRADLQNAVAWGTGYILEDWQKDFHGSHGDIRLTAYHPEDVTFVQLPKNHDIQQAYAVIIRDEMPLNLARATYRNIADQLTADRDKPGWLAKGLQAVQRLMGGSPALRVAGTRGHQQTGSYPTVDIYHMYTMDRSINMSPFPVTMGTKGTNWSYTVPALGDPLPTGIMNPATGQEFTRPAEEDDCKLFPLRRYSVFSRTAVSFDNSSPWWHGHVPVARTRFNDWAWQALGKSLLSDPRTMQDGIIALMRYIEDACAARLDPPVLYDEQLASEGFATKFNLRKAGTKASANLQAGEVLKLPVPVNHYDVPTGIYDWIKSQEQRINHMMGTPDLVAVAKAKQVPGEGTLEKLLEMAGPLVQDMMRAQEIPQHQLAMWRLSYFLQFYPKGRLIRTTGPEEDSDEFEYSPDLIVPAIEGESLTSKNERMKRRLGDFKTVVTESGINEMNRMTSRLALLQLRKAGVKIDDWTIAKAWRISNYGPEPENTHNVMQRWVAEQHMNRELAEEIGGGQVGGSKGRPPTNAKPPVLTQKDGGARSTIKTS